jgi:hypothetical protein
MQGTVGVLILFIGISIGVGGAMYGPDLAAPYLPDAFRIKKTETVAGEVMRKQREGDRLLLTVQTSQGTVLATFKRRVAEIDLLVQQGDALTMSVSRYAPFVEDPAIERVRKQDVAVQPKAGAIVLPAEPQPVPVAAPQPLPAPGPR